MEQKQISKNSNIAEFMHRHGFADYQELHKWSVNNRADYWQSAIDLLNISFKQKYTKILDLTKGIETPEWLSESKLNIVDSCLDHEGIAIICEAKQWTYEKLATLTNKVANSLIEHGYKKGDKIAIAMPMNSESVAIYLGIIKAGCVVVGIADSFAAEEITIRLQISKAKAIFTQNYIHRAGKTHELYQKIIASNAPRAIVLETDIVQREKDLTWQAFLSTKNEFESVVADPNDFINILFSSGTTASPKAIPWDHTSAIKAAADGYFHQDIKPQDRICWPTNLGWMMGPWLIFASLINKATIVLYPDVPTTQEFVDYVATSQVTMLGVVPSLVKIWRGNNFCDYGQFSKIKLFSSTGETSNESDMAWLSQAAKGSPVIEYCGGTEISGAYITSTVVQENLPATFSTPALGLDIRLIDNEVYIIPPSIGLSKELINKNHHEEYYAGVPEQSDGVTLRRHGDQMERLPNGYYRSLGRVDDVMNLGGIKVSCSEIERCFADIDYLLETAAIAVGTPAELIIFVALKSSVDLKQLQQVMQHKINQKLNPLFKISKLEIIDSLPRTSSNKVMRRNLRNLLTKEIY